MVIKVSALLVKRIWQTPFSGEGDEHRGGDRSGSQRHPFVGARAVLICSFKSMIYKVYELRVLSCLTHKFRTHNVLQHRFLRPSLQFRDGGAVIGAAEHGAPRHEDIRPALEMRPIFSIFTPPSTSSSGLQPPFVEHAAQGMDLREAAPR